jgi:hypothetical protein
MLLEPFIRLLPADAQSFCASFQSFVESRLGNFPQIPRALTCAEHTKTHIAHLTDLLAVIAPDIRMDVMYLTAVDQLAQLPELRAKRLAIDFFVVLISGELTEQGRAEANEYGETVRDLKE